MLTLNEFLKYPNGRIKKVPTGISSLDGYITFDLPTGTGNVSIKPMTGAEENILLSRDNRKNPVGAFFDVVKNCTKGLPLEVNPKTKIEDVKWRKVWMDDFSFILFMIRRLTYGDSFTFSVECPTCGKSYDWEENLDTTECLYASEELSNNLSSESPFFSFTMPVSR